MRCITESERTMFRRIKQGCIYLLMKSPDFIWNAAGRVLKKRVPAQYWDAISLERYARYLVDHFDEEWKKAAEHRRCLLINKGDYSYSYCNVAATNNMMTMIVYALYHRYIPVINFNVDKPDYFQWNWYFRQPYEIMNTDITGFEQKVCDVPHCELRVDMQMVHTPGNWKHQLFRMLYRRFIRFNQETLSYIEDEIKTVGDPSRMLGVLIRGTDYIKLRPEGHPVQPKPEEIMEQVKSFFQSGKYHAVYVATEEKKLYDMVGSAIGMQNIRENRRQYYDVFHEKNLEVIGKVHFDRENDNYWKGLEYISSLIILSRCQTLIAGNCGGTLFAVMMADYRDSVIFNYGVY